VDIASTSVRDLDIAIDGQIGGMTKLIFEKVQYVNQLAGVGLNFPKLSFDPIDDPEQEDAPWTPALPKLPTSHGTAKASRGRRSAAREVAAAALRARRGGPGREFSYPARSSSSVSGIRTPRK
jgi:hypothetical protein